MGLAYLIKDAAEEVKVKCATSPAGSRSPQECEASISSKKVRKPATRGIGASGGVGNVNSKERSRGNQLRRGGYQGKMAITSSRRSPLVKIGVR